MGKEEQKGNVQRYVDILSDAGFKAVFGEKRNKDVLIDLLNVVLPERKHIMDIRYATTELPGFTLENKSVRLDLRCTGDDGTEFIVEVQRYAQENIFRRCILYASQVYSSGTERGDGQEYCIPPVYLVCLIDDHAMIADRSDPIFKDRIITEYTFREKIIEDVPDETIFCIFVELNRFEKSLEECKKICFDSLTLGVRRKSVPAVSLLQGRKHTAYLYNPAPPLPRPAPHLQTVE